MEYLQQVKDSDESWQICLRLFCDTPSASDIARIFALDVVSSAIARRYREGGDPTTLSIIQDQLMKYIRRSYGPGSTSFDNAAIQNKVTQAITHLFLAMYGSSWTSFFHDILGITTMSMDSATGKPRRDNLPGVVFYLRVMASVHDEVADVLMARSMDEAQRNSLLKDQIRERDIVGLVSAWHEILAEWRDKNDDIVEMGLKVIGRWVGWINISLVITPEFVNFLWSLMTHIGKVKEASLDAMAEIVAKKMSASDKAQLIEFMKLVELIRALLTQDPTLQANTTTFNVDLAEKLAKLVNNVGSELVRSIDLVSPGFLP